MARDIKLSPDEKEVEEARLFAAISYIIVLCVVTLALKKENKFALFHGKQGLIILILWVAAAILRIVPLVGHLIWALSAIVLLLISLTGILQSLRGRYWKMPIIGEIAEKIKI